MSDAQTDTKLALGMGQDDKASALTVGASPRRFGSWKSRRKDLDCRLLPS